MARIGIGVPTYGAFPLEHWEFLRSLAAVADAAGVATLWLPDHLTLPEEDVRANGGETRVDEPFDPWVVLSMLAACTSRVRLGTEVTPLPLRHPVLLAQTVASLDALSGGRVVLGLGGGWYQDEFDEAGIPFRQHRERLRQTEEGARLVRSLLEGEVVFEQGEFYDVSGACVRPGRLEGTVPIWFGGRSNTVLRLVAGVGDGWIAATNASPTEVARGRTRLDELLHEAGRDPAEVEIAVPLVARVAATTEQARADVEAYIERGAFEGPVKSFLAEATRRYGIWGSPETCRSRLEPYLTLGVDEIILDVRPPDHALDSTERICGELLPLVAEEVPT
jgi:alkanesulfonate monooxygenase